MPKSQKQPVEVSKERARRSTAESAASFLRERLDAWRAPDGTVLPPPRLWEPAGRYEGIREQICLRCGARSGFPCLNTEGGATAEHRERVTLALRARGRDDVASLCGGYTKRGRLCGDQPLTGDVYCRTHRDKADRGLQI
jgi:hypothetical protein